MKKIGEVWRDMSDEDKAKWRADGEEGSRVPGSNLAVSHMAAPSPSSHQMFRLRILVYSVVYDSR